MLLIRLSVMFCDSIVVVVEEYASLQIGVHVYMINLHDHRKSVSSYNYCIVKHVN